MPYALSPQQKFVLASDRGDVPGRWRVTLALRPEACRDRLTAAVARLLAQHEILRTSFLVPLGAASVMQVVHPSAEITVSSSGVLLPEPGGCRAVLTWRGERAAELSLPAAALDDASLAPLLRDLLAAYGDEGGLPGETIQYADLSEHFALALEEPNEAAAGAWRPLVAEVDGRIAERGGARRGRRPERSAARVDLPPGLEAFCALRGIEPRLLLLAAWRHLAEGRLDGPVITVALGGRAYEGLDDAVGPYARETPVAPSAGTGDILADIAVLATEMRHAEELADDFDPRWIGGWAGQGAVPVLGFRSLDLGTDDGAPFTIAALETPGPWQAAELTVLRRGSSLAAQVVAEAGLGGGAEALARGFAAVIEAILRGCSAYADLPLAPEAELDAAYARLNALPAQGEPLTDLWSAYLAGAGAADAPAVADETGEWDGAAFRARAEAISGVLSAERGLAPGSAVGICVERSADALAALFAAFRSGLVAVPLDPANPEARTRLILEETGAALVLTSPGVERHLAFLDPALRLPLETVPRRGGPATPPAPVGPEAPAYVIFTSGSTGRPKGVVVPHGAVVNLARGLERTVYAAHPEVRHVTMNAPLTFDASVKQWVQLLHGRAVAVVPEAARYAPRRFMAFLAERRVDFLDATPTYLAHLVAEGLLDGAAPGLRGGLVGGEPVPAELWERLAASGLAFYNVYGPTEAADVSTVAPVRAGDPVTLGRALPGVEAHVMDDHGRLVPEGAEGEICLSGLGLALGYLGRESLTAERFVERRVGAGLRRTYRTGDRGRLDQEGRLVFAGRRDGQVKLRGYRVELGEIERLAEGVPGVVRAVAFVGDGETLSLAVTGSPDLGAVKASLRADLPEHMVPARLAAVPAIPFNRNGKADVAALRAILAREAAAEARPPAAPANEAEARLKGTWAAVLGTSSFGVDQNFFDVGGNSLLLVEVHERIEADFGRRLDLVELFKHPTVRGLARLLATPVGTPAPAVRPEMAEVDPRLRRRERQARRAGLSSR